MAHPSPLLEQHTLAEASTIPYGPAEGAVEVVETFGEVEFEYAAIRKACALFDLPHRATVEVRGSDRLSFLNSMLTQELRGLEPMRARPAFWLSRKGRIVADLRVLAMADRVRLDLDVHAAGETVRSLAEYVIAEDVQIEDVTRTLHTIALYGPTAAELLSSAATPAAEQTPAAELPVGAATLATIAGASVVIARNDLTGEFGVDVTAAAGEIGRVYRTLVELGSPVNGEGRETLPGRVKLRQTGWLAVNIARIEAGRAMQFVDYTGDALPAECGKALLHERVSFKKGCYLGQEVVARMHSLGKPKRVIVGLRPEGDPPRDGRGQALQPVGGAQVFAGPEGADPVGVVTSSTISPMLGGVPIALATVRTGAAVDGATVLVPAEGTMMPMRLCLDPRFYAGGS